jgi:hypothetical protein
LERFASRRTDQLQAPEGPYILTTMMVRNSERSSFNTCRHRWAWTWNNGVQAALAPYALRFGDLIHQALAAYYLPGRKRGEHPATTFAIIYHDQANELRDKGFDVYSDDKWVDALDLGVGMLNGYVEQYRDADDEYEVIASEQTFKVRVRVPATVINGEVIEPAFAFWMVGTFDGVWRNLRTGRLFFKEFKTAAAITDDGLNMDEQATLYYTYGPKWLQRHGLLGVGETISHILYTRLRKAIPDPEATYSPEGLVLNKPTKEALEEAWANLGNDSEGALPALPPRNSASHRRFSPSPTSAGCLSIVATRNDRSSTSACSPMRAKSGALAQARR